MRGQVSQAFSYIAMALVIGVIAYFGVKAVLTIFSGNCENQAVKFENDLMDFLEDYSDRGSVHYETLQGPCDSVKVCFVDADKLGIFGLGSGDDVIDGHIATRAYNVFYVDRFTQPVGLSTKVDVDETKYPGGFVCVEGPSRFKLKFTGTGKTTQVDEG